MLSFEIKDTGIGITESQQANLFQKFHQADSSTTRKYGGSGLGLYLSKNIAQIMGGDIIASSKIGIGSCFHLTVNAKQDGIKFIDEHPKTRQKIQIYHDKKPLVGHILLVDDYDDNRSFIGALLTSFGLTVDYSENGKIAVEKALIDEFDIILMDIQMPVMAGVEAMQLLKASGCGSTIIALTANVMRNEADGYLKAGFDSCLSKPIETEIFYNTLAEHLTYNKEHIFNEPSNVDLTELSESYQKTLFETLNKLKEAQQKEDWFTLSILCHQIKGAAASFGLKKIGEYAAMIETAATLKDKGKSDKILELIYQEINELRE